MGVYPQASPRTRLLLLALAAAVALVAAGVALAHERAERARTQAAAATFSASRTAITERTCAGVDAAHRETRARYTGTSTSADGRLAGRITIRIRSLVDQTAGLGTVRGDLVIRDAASGRVKASAKLSAVSTRGALSGILAGKVRDGGRLLANFRAEVGAAMLTGELGAGASADTAVIQRGECRDDDRRGPDDDDDDDDDRSGRRGGDD